MMRDLSTSWTRKRSAKCRCIIATENGSGRTARADFPATKTHRPARCLASLASTVRKKNEHGNTPAEIAMLWLMQNRAVNYAGALAGYSVGCHVAGQQRILVTEALRLPTPKAGKWPTIQLLAESLLDDSEHDQITVFT